MFALALCFLVLSSDVDHDYVVTQTLQEQGLLVNKFDYKTTGSETDLDDISIDLECYDFSITYPNE